MEKINDGGPAFPRSYQGPMGDSDREEGMTLRDWFDEDCKYNLEMMDFEFYKP